MLVKSIAECSKGSILQYFWPSLSYHLSLRSLFCLFLSCRFTPVLLYCVFIDNSDDFYEDLDKESKEEDKQTVKDKDSANDKDKNKAKKKIAQQALSREYVEYDEEDSSGHFMAFFLTATVLCVAGYVIFHNKQKVMMADSSLYLRHLCQRVYSFRLSIGLFVPLFVSTFLASKFWLKFFQWCISQ